MYRNKKLTDSARNEECVSCGNPECCWAHSNSSIHGKGRGLKAHDIFGAYLCLNCHDWLDGRSKNPPPGWFDDVQAKHEFFQLMNHRSLLIACEKGYL